MSLMNKLSQAARSPKGKELIGKARTIANDPKTREKLEGARGKIKDKIAEKRGKDAEPAATTAPPPPPPAPDTGDSPKAA